MKEKFLGLDPSLNSFGYCIIEIEPSGYILNSYTGTIKTKKERNIFKAFAIMEELESIKVFDNISFVGIEHYHYKANSNSQYELGELGGILRWHCAQKQIGLVEIPPSNLKKFATGNGLAGKEQVAAKARAFLK